MLPYPCQANGSISNGTRLVRFWHLLVVVVTMFAAAPADASARDNSWYSQSYRVEDGLPEGFIYAISQDSDGCLWLGSDVGLTRFDGVEFVSWGNRAAEALPDTSIRSLLSARDGSLWVGFRNGMVTRIDHGTSHSYSTRDGLVGGSVTALHEDRDGTIWVGSFIGLAKFKQGKWEAMDAKHGLPTRTTIRALREDRNGSLWVTSDSGLFSRARHDDRFELIVREPIRDVSEDKSGAIWVTDTKQGARLLQRASQPVSSDRQSRAVVAGSALLFDADGGLWVGTLGQGLWRTDVPGGGLERVQDPQAAFDGTNRMFQDRDGNVWIGANGLTRFFHHDVTMITSEDGLTSNAVRSVLATSDGTVWVATVDELNSFQRADRMRHRRYQWPAYALSLRSAGGLWSGAYGTVGSVVNGEFSELKIPREVRLGNVTAMADSGNELWLCHSGDRWLSRWNAGVLSAVEGLGEIAGKQCTAAYTDRQSRVWLGFGDGTVAVREHDDFRVYSAKDGLPAARVSAMFEDETGALWIATTGGLGRFRNQQIATWGARNGLPTDDLNAVVGDRAGYLWLGFAGGIVRLATSELDKAAADKAYRVRYRLFDGSDGLRDSPVRSSTPSATRSPDGSLWFTTAKGVAVIDPSRLSGKETELRVRITDIRSNPRRVVPLEQNTSLPPRTSMLQIDYGAVSLSDASKIRYQYMLEGVDTEWIDAGKRRQAFYTNLYPGNYRFRVSAGASGGHGVATDWAFVVEPAFYQTRAFYAAGLTAVLMLLATGWSLRLRILRRQFALVLAERARIGREIHDTLLQHLAATALQLETVAKKVDVSSFTSSRDLRHLRRQVEQYIDEARESILELRRPLMERRSLCDTLSDWVGRVLPQAEGKVDVVVSGAPQPYPHQVEDHLLRIAQEAIRNALRHGEANHVRVELDYGAEAFRLGIHDDGKGFAPPQAGKEGESWGLVGMRERTKRFGGTLTITSTSGVGTQIEALFDARRLQHDAS